MKPLIIHATATTPLIDFNPDNGKFRIIGRSTPEHPSEYYSQVSTWIDEYVKQPNKGTIIEIYFEYFNTSSSKCILELLRKLVLIKKLNCALQFVWYYEEEDEDMKDAGMDFSELLKAPFEIMIKPALMGL